MHMADALLSPGVGATMWALAGGAIAYAARKVRSRLDESLVPLMGVLGAFVFAAQMINFTIPGTGSSGHLGGGMLLAILLGPEAAFLVIASVLSVQAFFFADGGLLALGANIFNMGVLPCFVAYPLLYRPLAGRDTAPRRMAVASVIASVAALELGASGVVLETVWSGITSLPFASFALLMLPVHLAIGIVEGLVTAAVVTFVWRARPEILSRGHVPGGMPSLRKVMVGLAAATLVAGAVLSWFASAHPDGLEWSVAGVTGSEELAAPPDGSHVALGALQERMSFLPDYGFRRASADVEEDAESSWPAVDAGTSVSGVLGGAMTLALAGIVAFILRRRASAWNSRSPS